MIYYCPVCETEANVTHGDQIKVVEVCESCLQEQGDCELCGDENE